MRRQHAAYALLLSRARAARAQQNQRNACAAARGGGIARARMVYGTKPARAHAPRRLRERRRKAVRKNRNACAHGTGKGEVQYKRRRARKDAKEARAEARAPARVIYRRYSAFSARCALRVFVFTQRARHYLNQRPRAATLRLCRARCRQAARVRVFILLTTFIRRLIFAATSTIFAIIMPVVVTPCASMRGTGYDAMRRAGVLRHVVAGRLPLCRRIQKKAAAQAVRVFYARGSVGYDR